MCLLLLRRLLLLLLLLLLPAGFLTDSVTKEPTGHACLADTLALCVH